MNAYERRHRRHQIKTAIKTAADGFAFICFMAVMILILEIIGA